MNDLSIIIPVRRGDEDFNKLVSVLLKHKSDFEIIIIGPDFGDKKSSDTRLRFIHSLEGRAQQLNNGVLYSKKNNLWFLHADSLLLDDSLDTVQKSLKQNPSALFFFDLGFIKDEIKAMKLNEMGVTFRSRVLRMPFGDQGLFMSRRTFYKLGFFDEKALYGEDHLLVWKAHQLKIEVLPCKKLLMTSSRKYIANGWLKTTLKHVLLTYKQAFPELILLLRKKKSKRPSTGVAIFVKTPGHSPVKSRLAKTIGVDLAEEFFRLSLEATKEAVIASIKRSSGKIEAYWAVAEKDCLHHPLWSDFETITQGEGSLGDRLHLVYKNLLEKHDSVILIGADLPHLNFLKLIEGSQQLNSGSKFVMGKTDDGGFYLFGGTSEISKDLWSNVAYSTDKTADELVRNLGIDRFNYLENNFDIDHEADLARLSDYNGPELLPAQKIVIEWSKKYCLSL